jgi:pyruvate-formate lyase-activating enzyme
MPRREWDRKMNTAKTLQSTSHKDTVPLYPKTVILESTNYCNLRCRMCHIWGEGVSGKRQTGFIQETIWKNAIDELSTWNEQINLALHGAGEVLLHRDFFRILSYATSKRNIAAGFLTNGSLLSPEKARAVVDSGVTWIGFSVDGAEEMKYQHYRGADLKKIESTIEYLLTLRKGNTPSVFLNMVALPDLDTERFIQRWIDKVDEVKISTYRPIGHRDFLTKKVERIPCHLLNDMLVVAWNGDVVLCCEDIWAEELIGCFPEKSLFDLWHSLRFNEIRSLHKRGKFDHIGICADCDSWSNSMTTVELIQPANLHVTRCAAQACYRRIKKPAPGNVSGLPVG